MKSKNIRGKKAGMWSVIGIVMCMMFSAGFVGAMSSGDVANYPTDANTGQVLGGERHADIGEQIATFTGEVARQYRADVTNVTQHPELYDTPESYCMDVRNVTYNYVEMVDSHATNIKELTPLLQDYYIKSAQAAAKDLYFEQLDQGTTSDGYDNDYVMDAANVINGSMAMANSIYDMYGGLFKGFELMATQFTGDMSEVEWGIIHGFNGSFYQTYSNFTKDVNRKVVFTNWLEWYDQQQESIYFSNEQPIYCIWIGDSGDELPNAIITVYNETESAQGFIQKQITRQGDGVIFKLSDLGLDSGVYRLSDNLGQGEGYIEYFSSAFSDTGWEVSDTIHAPAILTFNISAGTALCDGIDVLFVEPEPTQAQGQTNFWIANNARFNYNMGNLNTCWGWYTYDYPPIYAGANNGMPAFYIYPGEITEQEDTTDVNKYIVPLYNTQIDIYEAFWDCYAIIEAASAYAEAAYNLVSQNPNTPFPYPELSDFTQQDRDNFKQIAENPFYAVMCTYINGIDRLIDIGDTTITMDEINVTAESFEMLARGEIYDAQGVKIYGNDTIFSVFGFEHNTTLYVNDTTSSEAIVAESTNGTTPIADGVFSEDFVQEVQQASQPQQQEEIIGYFMAQPFNSEYNVFKYLDDDYTLSKIDLYLQSRNSTYPEIYVMICPAITQTQPEVEEQLEIKYPDVQNPIANVTIPANTIITEQQESDWFSVYFGEGVAIEKDVTYFIVLSHPIVGEHTQKYAWGLHTNGVPEQANVTNDAYVYIGRLEGQQLVEEQDYDDYNDLYWITQDAHNFYYRLYAGWINGTVNEWDQDGFILVYGHNDTIQDYLDTPVTNSTVLNNYEPQQQSMNPDTEPNKQILYVQAIDGYIFVIYEIMFPGDDGEYDQQEQQALTIDNLGQIVQDLAQQEIPLLEQKPTLTDFLNDYWWLILMVIGAIIILLAWIFGPNWCIISMGGVMLMIGLVGLIFNAGGLDQWREIQLYQVLAVFAASLGILNMGCQKRGKKQMYVSALVIILLVVSLIWWIAAVSWDSVIAWYESF